MMMVQFLAVKVVESKFKCEIGDLGLPSLSLLIWLRSSRTISIKLPSAILFANSTDVQ